MVSLWKHYSKDYAAYETSFPPAFPWNREGKEDVPRYVPGADGYWYDPQACDTGKAVLSCTGDLMCEPRMMEACHYGDTYFFHPLFQYVRKILKNSDFSVGNLETTVTDCTPYAGEYHRIDRKYHCNAPESYLDALRYGGFDALVAANNHNCDSGLYGITDTLNKLDAHGFMHTGLFRPTDRQRVLLVKINGIRVAVLSYGSRYNDLDTQHLTQAGRDVFLNWFDREKCCKDVAFAREQGAEFVLCYIHWGKDYDLEPNAQQLAILEELKETGVDYIVGSHTHCLQAHHVAVAQDGRKIPMMFSMGNFVTNESKELCRHTGILQLMLCRETDRIAVREYFIPCYVFASMGTGSYCVVPADSQLNGGIGGRKLEDVRAYVRQRIGPEPEYLPTGAITLAELCAAMGVPMPGDMEDTPVVHLAVQPSAARRNGLYFAMTAPTPAEKRALRRRWITTLVTAEPVDDFACILVPDVQQAYLAACDAVRQRVGQTKTVLVTGPEGKTVTRELIGHVLKAAGGVLTVQDGYQVDMTPWQELHPSHAYCVQELRPDHPMGLAVAVKAAAPQICVVTGCLDDLQAVAWAMAEGSLLLLNQADAALMQQAEGLQGNMQIKTYGGVRLEHPGLPLPEMESSAQAAYGVGREAGLDETLLRQRIAGYRAAGYTQNVIAVDGVTLVLNTNCKSYDSAVSAISAMARYPGRKIAVLADLDGDLTQEHQQLLVQQACRAGAQVWTCTGIPGRGAALEKQLCKALKEGDVLLLCGGRKMELNLTLRRLFGLTDGFIPDK